MAASTESWLDRNHFVLRRLHSLSGIVPVGVFLMVHLYTNSLAWYNATAFNEEVSWIHHLPYLLILEIVGIFAPLAFHAVYGVVIAMQGRANVGRYPYMDNWRYTLQRVTAWITLAFILTHVAHFRFAEIFGGQNYIEAVAGRNAFEVTQLGFLAVPPIPVWLYAVWYVIGITASVFHFCNGIATFCITWGITVGDVARKRVAAGAMGLGLILVFWGFASLYALTTRPAMQPLPNNIAGEPAHVAQAGALTAESKRE